jgi:aspartate aminotransferase
VVVNGFSKAFSMTGWRLGYAAGPRELIGAMQRVQDQSTSNPNSIAQKAGVAALQGPTEPLALMVAEFRARRDFLVRGLNGLPGVSCGLPDGAFYAFPSFKGLIGKRYRNQTLTGSVQLSQILLDDFRVAAVPGAPFGAEGFLRLSFATSREVIEKGLVRLGELVRALS